MSTPEVILKLNEEFSDLLLEDLLKGLPASRVTDHRIDLKPDSKTPAMRSYLMSPAEEVTLMSTLDDLLDKGFIEPANLSHASGVLFVSKANGKLRLVVNFKPLNQNTIVEQYHLQRIDELLDQAGGSQFCSKLDLHSGFHQIRLNPESVHKTAFQTKFGSYQYLVMPFGLCNAPATFQRITENLQECTFMTC